MRCAPKVAAAAPQLNVRIFQAVVGGGAGGGCEHRGEGDGGERDRDEDVAEMNERGEGIRPIGWLSVRWPARGPVRPVPRGSACGGPVRAVPDCRCSGEAPVTMSEPPPGR